jgi:hypothetical protein
MATSKTGSFWLTERLALPASSVDGTRVQSTLDLGAYVDVGDQQAIAIEFVDFIWQNGSNFDQYAGNMALGDGAFGAQLSDLNPGTVYQSADNNSLIASGALNIDKTNNVLTIGPDLYPDSFGKLDESRMVVNDTLYLVGGWDGAANTQAAEQHLTVRIRARIVKLTTKDWMAIAIQSTASDN